MRRRRVSEVLTLTPVDAYERQRIIGSGAFSTVWLARKTDGSDESRHFVVKDVALDAMSEQDKEAAISEVSLHSKLNHINIIKYVEVMRPTPNLLAIVLEYAEGGDLAAFLAGRKKAGSRLAEKEGMVWFGQVLSAVDYMHKQGMIHRDIKAANIFLAINGNTKLGDFNLSKILDCNARRMSERTCSTPCGTPMYNSPEQWLRGQYTQQVDIWALGCLLYEMLFQQPTFVADNMESLQRNIFTGSFDRTVLGTVSPQAKEIVLLMLTHEARRRPSASELLKMKVIAEGRSVVFIPPELGGTGIAHPPPPPHTAAGRRGSRLASVAEEAESDVLPSLLHRAPRRSISHFGKEDTAKPIRRGSLSRGLGGLAIKEETAGAGSAGTAPHPPLRARSRSSQPPPLSPTRVSPLATRPPVPLAPVPVPPRTPGANSPRKLSFPPIDVKAGLTK